jgi:hypothetical protein
MITTSSATAGLLAEKNELLDWGVEVKRIGINTGET